MKKLRIKLYENIAPFLGAINLSIYNEKNNTWMNIIHTEIGKLEFDKLRSYFDFKKSFRGPNSNKYTYVVEIDEKVKEDE